MKRISIIMLLSVLSVLYAFVYRAEDPVDRLVTALQKWADQHPQEKVYLQTDKPYYAVGDTLWFKAYVTIGSRHQLSKLSGALYVELTDGQDSLVKQLKLPLTAGMAMGDLTLGDEYKQGNYRLRAYTQWMRNAEEDYFFDKSFVIGDPLELEAESSRSGTGPSGRVRNKNKQQKDNQPSDSLSASDVQFFPEGGTLVNGIASRIGFKATGKNGRGVKVKGKVLDNSGAELGSFESQHAGMGVFQLKPEQQQAYRARLSFEDGSSKTVPIPQAATGGYTLGVYQLDRDSILVRVNTVWGASSTPQTLNLVVQSGGEPLYAGTVQVTKSINSVWLSKKNYPSGVIQFTLFSGAGSPLAERLGFIKNPDRMQLGVSTTKSSYQSRERVEVSLESMDSYGDPVSGNFSVSVTDEDKVPSDENNENSIYSSLLLSSELKGYIEQPNYYFSSDSRQVNKALDNLMLTQGYRKFVWKEITGLTTAQARPAYPAESLGTALSGRVQTLSGKAVVNGTVTLMSLTPGFMEQVKTDTEGRFHYDPIMLADSLKFAVQARTSRNSKKVEVILDEIPEQGMGPNKNKADFSEDIVVKTREYLENSRKEDEQRARTGGLSRVNRLKEVKIKAKRLENGEMKEQGIFQIPDGHADIKYVIDNPEGCATLGICLQGHLGGVAFRPFPTVNPQVMSYPYFRGAAMQLFLDGKRITDLVEAAQILDMNSVDPKDIYKIEAVTTNMAMLAMVSSLGGIGDGISNGPALFVYTRKNRSMRYTPNIVNIKPKGFNMAREFYMPRYDRPNISQQQPDLRSTIYWNPRLKTYANGKTSFSFFNADGPGKYKVVIEGINAAGELGRAVYHYEVTGEAAAKQPEPLTGKTSELVKAMQELHQRKPAEKLYLHTDKPYYNIGDTLWFKAYLFDAASLTASKKSGLLYVELNGDTSEVVRRISIPIKDGTGYAQIPLTSTVFHEGGYTLRAYTNWMQNFGSDYFFSRRLYLGVPTSDTWLARTSSKISRQANKDQLEIDLSLNRADQTAAGLRNVEIAVMEGDKALYRDKLQTKADGSLVLNYPLKEKADGRNIWVELKSMHPNDGNQRLVIPVKVQRTRKTDLQFLPEGGRLVAGQKSRVGFKAIAEDGRGVDIAGEVYNHNGSKVAEFASLYKGMGSFELVPEAGEKYTAVITQPEATEISYNLPQVENKGTILKVINEEHADSLKIIVQATTGILTADSIWTLAAVSNGVVTDVQHVENGRNSYSIAKSLLPEGISSLTLLRNKTPLNQRLVFIDHQDQLQVAVSKNKNSYLKRDSVSLTIQVKNKTGTPVKGNFSIAVTDDGQVKPDSLGNNSIAAGLLIRSALKGEIETPGYYLHSQDDQHWQALDNLMLTQGWTGYSWKEVFQTPAEPQYEAEKYFKIKGTVFNILKKPVAGAQMLISSQKPFFITTTLSDSTGNYVFENLPQIDSGSFFIQARTPKGKTMRFGGISVEQFSAPKPEDKLRNPVEPWYVNSEVTQLNYVKNAKLRADESSLKLSGIGLKEVKITGKKLIKGSYNRNGPGKADKVFDEQEIKQSATTNLYQLIKQKLPGLKVVYDENMPTILWNGYQVVIEIDGAGLPIRLDEPYGVEQLIDELEQFTIQNMVGMEVMYSSGYIRGEGKYTIPSPGGVDRYAPSFRADNYLEQRAMGPNMKFRSYAVIEVTTRSNRGWYQNNRPDYVTLRPLPLMQPREFYSPKYNVKNKDLAEPDYRSTVYWKPNIATDANGKAMVSFYTGDAEGSYTVNVQGSDMDGSIGSGIGSIKVSTPARSK